MSRFVSPFLSQLSPVSSLRLRGSWPFFCTFHLSSCFSDLRGHSLLGVEFPIGTAAPTASTVCLASTRSFYLFTPFNNSHHHIAPEARPRPLEINDTTPPDCNWNRQRTTPWPPLPLAPTWAMPSGDATFRALRRPSQSPCSSNLTTRRGRRRFAFAPLHLSSTTRKCLWQRQWQWQWAVVLHSLHEECLKLPAQLLTRSRPPGALTPRCSRRVGMGHRPDRLHRPRILHPPLQNRPVSHCDMGRSTVS